MEQDSLDNVVGGMPERYHPGPDFGPNLFKEFVAKAASTGLTRSARQRGSSLPDPDHDAQRIAQSRHGISIGSRTTTEIVVKMRRLNRVALAQKPQQQCGRV